MGPDALGSRSAAPPQATTAITHSVSSYPPEPSPTAQIRRDQLTRYLLARENATHLLVGEASGWQGCRFSGIPFTSERMVIGRHETLQQEVVFGNAPGGERTSTQDWQNGAQRRFGMAEASATILWKAVLEHLCAFDFVLWNVVPWHPHQADAPRSNRSGAHSLTCDELYRGGLHLQETLQLFPNAVVVAVGEMARVAVSLLRQGAACVRHPSHGADQFRREIAALLGN